MNVITAIILGIIQGLTEFIPVSSSGHLVIYNALLGSGGEVNLAFSVLLHLGTLCSVFAVFAKDVQLLVCEFFAWLVDISRGKRAVKTASRRYLFMVIIATIPAVLAGVAIKLLNLTDILENVFVAAFMLLITSAFMFLIDRMNKGRKNAENASYISALTVGLFQAMAILPGLSRSGSTIFAGLLGRYDKEFAVKFAFILSIPVIIGAGLLELIDAWRVGEIGMDALNMAVGFFAAFISGIFAIKFVRMLISSNRFYLFGIYCLAASAIAVLAGLGVIGM